MRMCSFEQAFLACVYCELAYYSPFSSSQGKRISVTWAGSQHEAVVDRICDCVHSMCYHFVITGNRINLEF